MKQGTIYAARLKKVFARQRAATPAGPRPDSSDPVRQLCIGVLGLRLGEEGARAAVNCLMERMIDWNEVRVSHASEIQQAVNSSDPRLTTDLCQRLRDALQEIYHRENRVCLDRLKSMGRREARQYLDGLKGVDSHAAASVILWSLGGHAIPVDDRLLEALRVADLVHPEAERAEVQAFLERNISALDAREFCIVMSQFTPGTGTPEKAGRTARTTKSTRKK